ncbi:MAG: ABC transporter ATP-binding protein [Verrucomicrobiota bacterium]
MKELGRVFAYCARYRGYAFGTFGCATLSTLALLFVPFLTQKIFELIEEESVAGLLADGFHLLEIRSLSSQLTFLAAGALGAFLFRDILNAARIYFNNLFEQRVIYDIRSDLYYHIQCLPLSWFDDKASGDVMTRVSEDVTDMERVLIDGIEQGSVALLQILGVMVYLMYLSVSLTLLTLIPIPLMLLGAYWYTTTAHKRYRLIRKATSAMNALLMDNLQGISQIKSFVREKDEWNHFNQTSEELRSATLRVMRAWAFYSPSMAFFASLGTVIVLYFGGSQVLSGSGELTKAELVGFIVAVGFLYEPVNRLHGLNQLFQSGRAAAERVFGILDTNLETQPENPNSLPETEGARRVEFCNVSFEYEPDQTVLKDICITAEAGQTIALVGPTGAGKSTLVGLIPRFYQGYRGEVKIDGTPNSEIDLSVLRSEIGIVSQEAFLFNDTLRRNLLFGNPSATEEDCWRVLEAANAREFIEALPKQLDTEVGERGIKLSVGEKQRVSIARALLKNPPILILDEATASVDTATEKLIQEALDYLLENRTSFVIAHRLSTITRADKILVLKDGEIIEQGTHNELLEFNGLYAKLCASQSTGTIESAWENVELAK